MQIIMNAICIWISQDPGWQQPTQSPTTTEKEKSFSEAYREKERHEFGAESTTL